MIPRCAQVILVKVRCGCVIVQENDSVLNRSGEWLQERYRKHQLIEPTINRPIKPTNRSNQRLTDRDQPTEWSRTTAQRGQTTLAKAKTNREAIDQTITITNNIADSIGWGLELVRGLDQGLEVWNRPGARSRLRRPWRFRRFRRLM